jgi:predicted enzyme related to lactoylglutathione lyase
MMPVPTSYAEGAPIWVDLTTSKPGEARAFYEGVFGWTSEVSGEAYGGYVILNCNGAPVAGLGENPQPGEAPDGWVVYLNSSDIAATAAAIGQSEGTVLVEPMDIPGQGKMLIANDATGAAFGVWQIDGMGGFGLLGELGAPAWFELLTRDYVKAIGFYTKVFGVVTEIIGDGDGFRYSQVMQGDTPVSGIEDASESLPAEVPPHWTVYFEVEDADGTLERVTSLGGRVVDAAEDTPYGRIAVAADVTGAPFRILQPLE